MATKEEIKKRIEIMQAWLNGEDMQYRNNPKGEGKWLDVPNTPSFSFGIADYRIKPKPREMWVNVYDGFMSPPYLTEEDAVYGASSKVVKAGVLFREVIEDEE